MSADPSTNEEADRVISHDEIQERAYDLWDRNHRPDGYELEFWLMAECELRAERRAALHNEGETGADA